MNSQVRHCNTMQYIDSKELPSHAAGWLLQLPSHHYGASPDWTISVQPKGKSTQIDWSTALMLSSICIFVASTETSILKIKTNQTCESTQLPNPSGRSSPAFYKGSLTMLFTVKWRMLSPLARWLEMAAGLLKLQLWQPDSRWKYIHHHLSSS